MPAASAKRKSVKVPADVWADLAAEPESAAPAEPLERLTRRELADAQVERLRGMVRDAKGARPPMKAADVLKIEAELRAAIAARAKLELDEEAILESPAWATIEGTLLEAVKSLPAKCTRAQVAQALGEALKGIHAMVVKAAA